MGRGRQKRWAIPTLLNLLIPPLSGITLTSAVGINAAGEIVAYGTNSSGQSHEYFLTPLESPVPEPSTLVFVGMAIAGLGIRRARGRRKRPDGVSAGLQPLE